MEKEINLRAIILCLVMVLGLIIFFIWGLSFIIGLISLAIWKFFDEEWAMFTFVICLCIFVGIPLIILLIVWFGAWDLFNQFLQNLINK